MNEASLEPRTPLERAIWIARSQGKLAREIGVKPQALTSYLKKGVPPLDRCAAIERATGVKCEDLRPDVEWQRNEHGVVIGYLMRVPAASN